MRVEDWMKRKVHTVAPRDDLLRAWRLMMTFRIRHLPVLDPDGNLIGILSDRDIKKHAIPAEAGESMLARQKHLREILAEQVMVRNVVTVSPQSSMLRAAGLMRAHGINSLPVLAAQRLEGMLTSSDYLDFFVHYFGMVAGNRLIGVEAPNTVPDIVKVLGRLQPEHGPAPNMLIKHDEQERAAYITLIVPEKDADAVMRALNVPADAVETIG